MEELNLLHKTIKFTSEYDHDKKSTMFLDTTISIKNGKKQICTEKRQTKYNICYQVRVTRPTSSKVYPTPWL
jgi:hypothetical protein